MRVTLWGTRGSLPSLGSENTLYGGNTPSVEVSCSDGTLLVLDAGTGIRRLGTTVPADQARLDVLLTHLHMDHLQGLGFFEPLFRPGIELNLWGPGSADLSLRDRVLRALSPPLYPIRLRDLPSQIAMLNVPRGTFGIGSLTITADYICHPGPTVGYRIEEGDHAIAYLPDHELALGEPRFPGDPEWTSGYALARNVDLLIHDCTYSAVEYPERQGWGHSAIDHAIAFASLARARRLVTFHHDPGHDDGMLDRMLESAVAAAAPTCDVVPGTEGASYQVGP